MTIELSKLSPEVARRKISYLLFAMRANGYSPQDDGLWVFDETSKFNLEQKLTPLSYLFYSYNPKNWSALNKDAQGRVTASVFKDEAVGRMINRFYDLDPEGARRICFLLGFVSRYLNVGLRRERLPSPTKFVANMTNLGGKKSGEAIAAAMAMHVINGNPIVEDGNFRRDIYQMTEAIEEDSVPILSTVDFGLTQALRLWRFVKRRQNGNGQEITVPDFLDNLDVFRDFPTIGAEFHIQNTSEINNGFWQRVTLLNISQYLRGSYIPFSRTDEGLIEIRMNPSPFPVAVATWNLMRHLLPELNNSYFTISLNRGDDDFVGIRDGNLISFLHKLGMVCYVSSFKTMPQIQTPRQVNFGDYYLGQTVTLREEIIKITGYWGGGHNDKYGVKGQLNICTGFGNLFPQLAFYLSMALAEPSLPRILSPRLSKINNILNVLNMRDRNIKGFFVALNNLIENNKKLSRAAKTGPKIIEALRP